MAGQLPVSPLAPRTTPTLPRIAGVELAAHAAGLRYQDRDDLMLAVLAPGSVIAGVLTKSKTSSAPVEWCRKNLSRRKVRAIIVNAGNANAFTGKAGTAASTKPPARWRRRSNARATKCSWPRPA